MADLQNDDINDTQNPPVQQPGSAAVGEDLAGSVNVQAAQDATYQDDLDTGNDDVDPFSNEATEDPTALLQIPPEEFKDELDKVAIDDIGRGDDDMRETIEDRDEADDNGASTA